MKLQGIDAAIILLYLISILLVGWALRKKAGANKESYLLGSKALPWYMLSLSNASDMFDISGTMWMVALLFLYGLKSIWIPWLWPSFNQVFMMMFLSQWLRRSKATTGAEWLATRFGTEGRGVKAAHFITVAFALISCLGFMAYGFIGLGKFIEIFLPWSFIQPYIPFTISSQYVPHFYGIIFTFFAAFYSILGGMHSLVINDVIKYSIMTITCIAIATIAMLQLKNNTLNIPHGWLSPFFGKELNLNWQNIIPAADKKIEDDGFSLFHIFFMMMLFKGIIASLTGPAPNYDMQKVLSTHSPADAAKMTGFVSIFLYPVRYAMIAGVVVLALLHYNQLGFSSTGTTDFEKILPAAISNFLPAGILGLALASLLGAFMGTFSGTLNAAQAYIVNDIYLKHSKRTVTQKKIVAVTYMVGFLILIISIALGFFVQNVNSALQWITSSLYGGYIAANVLKWFWWRFNANGFFWGMISGIVSALLLPYLKVAFPGFFFNLDLYNWPLLFLISVIGCIAGTYSAPATDMQLLKKFYTNVRPWGFWKPVYKEAIALSPTLQPNNKFWFDMMNVTLGVMGQCCLALLPIYIILWMGWPAMITALLLLIILIILRKTWWKKLSD